MPLQLIRLHTYPDRIAATKSGTVAPDGAFFLDFSRPLKSLRAFAVGPVKGLLVPVVHQGEATGGFAISVARGQAYFVDLPVLWAQHYPASQFDLREPADNLSIAADFARQFPEDCR